MATTGRAGGSWSGRSRFFPAYADRVLIHRATVVDNIDPQGLGRLRLVVPDVSPDTSPWASLVLPLGATQLPSPVPVGTEVWIVYENDDVDFPVVLGQLATLPFATGSTPATPVG